MTDKPAESNKNEEPSQKISQISTTVEQLTDAEEPEVYSRLALTRTFSSDFFLNKHSPSFRCLEQFLCSKSDLRLTLSFFPPPTDPGLDEALNYIAPEEIPNPDGSDKYIKTCEELTIVPIRRVITSLATDTLDLKYYGITLKQMRGIAAALRVNSNIKYLILQDNWLSPEAASLISEVLRESNSIRSLNLRECRLGLEGIEKLCEGIASTQFLRELDLSFNNLGDAGLKAIQSSLIENTSMKRLNISHNELTENSGPTLEEILLENKCLEELDLSWNGFFTGPGNKKLCNGLAQNEFITWLNLSWNGISTGPAMRPITKFIRKSKVLRYLDLSWNRFWIQLIINLSLLDSSRLTQRPLKLLMGALNKNQSIEQVKVGNNIFTPDEAYSLATVFAKTKNQNLKQIDLENMCVNKDFLQLKREYSRNQKTLSHGHVLSNYKIHGPNISKLLFQRCKFLAMKPKRKKQKKDFGHFILSLPDKNLTSEGFLNVLKKKKIKKLDKDLLNELMSHFPSTKGKKIDCETMKSVYMKIYPDTVLPEEPKKKGKKGKKQKKKSLS